MSRIRVLVFPRDRNPYQHLLYGAMSSRRDVDIRYVDKYPYVGGVLAALTILIHRMRGYRLVHIHWPDFRVTLPLFPYNKRLSLSVFKLAIGLFKVAGCRLVWTVHNVLPHEAVTSDDLEAMRWFSRQVDAKIVHSASTLEEMREHGVDTVGTHIIPHGNYDGFYPARLTATEARARLGIDPGERVVLFFGLIRPYKGVDRLVEAFGRLAEPGARLVLAGNCLDPGVPARVTAAGRSAPITFVNGYVPDEEVATYFLAANVVCLPFTSVTTSGSALLALTFGKPVIAPRSGALRDIPEDAGWFYDAARPEMLEGRLKEALASDRLEDRAERATVYARSLAWEGIADRTYDVYSSVLGGPDS